MDILVAGGALLFFAPLLALVAVLIKLESPGPVLFRQFAGRARTARASPS